MLGEGIARSVVEYTDVCVDPVGQAVAEREL
jgi:hypothetical protein